MKVTAKFQRRKHRKSRNGCPHCKLKKMKCDETLPSCLNCSNRKLRCGYLDYSKTQIDIIRLAHWEAEGSDPAKNPVASQQYNPAKPLIVYRYDQGYYGSKDTPLNHDVRSASVGPISPIGQIGQDFKNAPNYDHPVQYWTENTDNLRTQHVPVVSQTLPKPFKSNLPELEIPLIQHNPNIPGFADIRKTSPYFNEPVTSTLSRIYCIQRIHHKITSAFTDFLIFNALQLQGVGPFLAEIPELESYFLKYRGYSMSCIVKGLSNVTDSNSLILLMAISLLNDSSVFLEIDDEVENFKKHFALASGPGSLLREAYSTPELFPKSFKTLKQHADSLMFTTKFVWFPQYSHEVLNEFLTVLSEFGDDYMVKEMVSEDVIEQYENMVEFIEMSLDLFENERSSECVLKYPIGKLYKLIQRWYAIVPSDMFTLGATSYSNVQKVFYVFWFSLLQILEMVLPGCRYIFTFFLDGYYLCYPFQKEELIECFEADDDLLWYFNYSCRIISFFVRRRSYILRNTVLNDLIPNFLHLKDRLKARPLEIQESFITSFRNTKISKAHYPVQSMRSFYMNPDLTVDFDSANYYHGSTRMSNSQYDASIMSTPNSGLSSSNITPGGPDDPLNDYFDLLLDTTEANLLVDDLTDFADLDFVHNINQETSLLHDDYDPRFTDSVFDERVLFQSTNLEFINKYVEDRMLIIQMDA